MAERKKIEIIKKDKWSLRRDFYLKNLKEVNPELYKWEIYNRKIAVSAMREVDDETFKLFLEFHYSHL